MINYNLTSFGEINPTDLKESYEGETTLNDRVVTLDLNFDEESIDVKKLDRVKDFIENISKYNDIAVKAQNTDFNSDGVVKEYIEHHVDITEDDDNDAISTKEKQLFSTLHLKRIGFYPDNEDQFAVFDYTVGQDLTDYLIVVNFQQGGHIDHMTMES